MVNHSSKRMGEHTVYLRPTYSVKLGNVTNIAPSSPESFPENSNSVDSTKAFQLTEPLTNLTVVLSKTMMSIPRSDEKFLELGSKVKSYIHDDDSGATEMDISREVLGLDKGRDLLFAELVGG